LKETEAPYRDAVEPSPYTLTEGERSQLAAAGRRLALGAWLGVIAAFAVAAWFVAGIHPPTWFLALLVLLAIVALAWLRCARRAARALANLGDAGADYRGLAIALAELRVAFALRGTVLLALAALFVLLVLNS
jgi:hypothetical protein